MVGAILELYNNYTSWFSSYLDGSLPEGYFPLRGVPRAAHGFQLAQLLNLSQAPSSKTLEIL